MVQTALPEFADLKCLLRATGVLKNNPVLPGHNMPYKGGLSLTGLLSQASDSMIEYLPVGCHGYLVYWPAGKPPGRITAVVSSRLGRELESHEAWFRALRATCARLAEQKSPVVNVAGTAVSRFLPRATELFATKRIDVQPAQQSVATVGEWWDAVSVLNDPAQPGVFPAFVSMPVAVVSGVPTTRPLPVGIPAADLLAVCFSSDLYALHVRKGGHTHKLIKWRLDDSATPKTSVQLAIGPKLNTPKVQEDLLASGAVGWFLYKGDAAPDALPAKAANSGDTINQAADAEPTLTDGETFLTHCTRRRNGPWPDQTEKSFLDDLILNRGGVDHSPFSALQRIVVGRKLIASGLSIRGGTAVVSFTAVPLAELHTLRVFRSHRGRWDFEPYGISIRGTALQSLLCDDGKPQRVGPVAYATAQHWSGLKDADRPFFQKTKSVTRTGNEIHWTVEQEWRAIGDVDLTKIASDDALVFVPTEKEAALLQPHSPWRVIALELNQR